MDKRHSYTAASTLPVKLLRSRDLIRGIEDMRIPPLHVQFIPTNRCNLACSFCSCANRIRGLEMDLGEAVRLIGHLADMGTKAVTITGGGEPLLHPDIGGIIAEFRMRGIEVGLVTNGELLHTLPRHALRQLRWCRISASDERVMPDIEESIQSAPAVDWAFSYVLSREPNIPNLAEHFAFAEDHDFTHVRVVSDLLDIEASAIDTARESVDSPLAIWQGRKEYERGMRECRISLLKPVIGPDGTVYPCCGVQYAHEQADLDLPDSMSMGHWSDLGAEMFDGSQCDRCYYGDYNRVLAQMDSDIDHLAFV